MTCVYCGGSASWVGPTSALYIKCSQCGATDCVEDAGEISPDEEPGQEGCDL